MSTRLQTNQRKNVTSQSSARNPFRKITLDKIANEHTPEALESQNWSALGQLCERVILSKTNTERYGEQEVCLHKMLHAAIEKESVLGVQIIRACIEQHKRHVNEKRVLAATSASEFPKNPLLFSVIKKPPSGHTKELILAIAHKDGHPENAKAMRAAIAHDNVPAIQALGPLVWSDKPERCLTIFDVFQNKNPDHLDAIFPHILPWDFLQEAILARSTTLDAEKALKQMGWGSAAISPHEGFTQSLDAWWFFSNKYHPASSAHPLALVVSNWLSNPKAQNFAPLHSSALMRCVLTAETENCAENSPRIKKM